MYFNLLFLMFIFSYYLVGDGRIDSSWYNAQFCTYTCTFSENFIKKILFISTLASDRQIRRLTWRRLESLGDWMRSRSKTLMSLKVSQMTISMLVPCWLCTNIGNNTSYCLYVQYFMQNYGMTIHEAFKMEALKIVELIIILFPKIFRVG